MRNSRSEFFTLAGFLVIGLLVLTNGFAGRISAAPTGVDPFNEIEPIGVVLDEIMKNYVDEPDVDEVVEGALKGMMRALDDNSSYISPDMFREITEDTEGQFEGIGVSIKLDDDENIYVYQPIMDAPAAKAGVRANDYIVEIDGESTQGMTLEEAAKRIKGPRGTEVSIKVVRRNLDDNSMETLEFSIKRGRIPLESVSEWRLLEGGIGYIRVTEFRRNTASEIADFVAKLGDQGMKALIVDLRWNPGGLLDAAKDVSDLFLPPDKLVTYTKGRDDGLSRITDNIELFTDREPIVSPDMPMVVLTNGLTASSSEIVTGALQFWERALIVGDKTFGKGSVQTIIQLQRPMGAALRLTTAHYYTPARVCIDKQGIIPDVEVPVSWEEMMRLLDQMYRSYENDPDMRNKQNHGTVTGNELGEEGIEDAQLKRAVEILKEESVFEKLIAKYHRDTAETQLEAKVDGAANDVL